MTGYWWRASESEGAEPEQGDPPDRLLPAQSGFTAVHVARLKSMPGRSGTTYVHDRRNMNYVRTERGILSGPHSK
jgi:hypothetical protein